MNRSALRVLGVSLLVIGVFIGGCAPVARAQDPVQVQSQSTPPTSSSCQNFIASLPADVLRGWVSVPEDPGQKESDQNPALQIFYYGRFVPGQTPILFINGGPTEDSHGEFKLMNDPSRMVKDWVGAPLIFFDQRGNGCSSGYPQGKSEDVIARLRFYGARGIVADAEAIRKQLVGDKPWKIFGQSYGAWVVHRYATDAPEALAGAFAQANVISPDPIERVTNRIYSQARVLEEYLKRFPQDRAGLQSLHQALTPGKCFPDAASVPRRCGLNTIYSLTQKFPFTSRWNWIHSWLAAMVKNGVVQERVVNEYLKKIVFYDDTDPANNKTWARAVIDSFDRNVPPFDRPTCELIYTQLRARGENPETYLLHECMVVMQFPAHDKDIAERLQKLAWLQEHFGSEHLKAENLKASLEQHPQLKFHLYSGQLDTMVPVESFHNELAALGNLVTYKNFLGSGHDGYYVESEIAEEVIRAATSDSGATTTGLGLR